MQLTSTLCLQVRLLVVSVCRELPKHEESQTILVLCRRTPSNPKRSSTKPASFPPTVRHVLPPHNAIHLLACEKTGPGNSSSSYRLYWSSLYTGTEGSGGGPHGCTTPTDGVSLMNNSNCMFSSVCGMERVAEGWSDWETLPNGASHSFEVRQSRAI